MTEDLAKALKAKAAKFGFGSPEEYLDELERLVDFHHLSPGHSKTEVVDSVIEPFLNREGQNYKGTAYLGDSLALMHHDLEPNSVDLVFTSPPFALNKKKSYGNEESDDYLKWFEPFAEGIDRVIKENGSLVIDIGGVWKKQLPTRSLYHFELVSMLCRKFGWHLCQEFYWWNPGRLPSPAEWTNIRRIRVKDAVNVVWWLSKTPFPQASNKRVLQPYSSSMRKLLKKGSYNAGVRPSGYHISSSGFLNDHGGSIPPNLIAISNNESSSAYRQYCRENGITPHPAPFPPLLPAMFIRMLTEPGDLILDPFAGTCATGEAAEKLNRSWICCELDEHFLEGAKGRFQEEVTDVLGRHDLLEMKKGGGYSISSPSLSVLPEELSPLPKDGGASRPKKAGS